MKGVHLVCVSCGSRAADALAFDCASCGGVLDVVLPLRRARFSGTGVWRYRDLLPVRDRDPVTLGEGGTGLHRVQRLLRGTVFVKNEGENPTGSFKDRGMTVGVTLARSLGIRRVVCASTGNTAASLAAYAARAGIPCAVLLPAGQVAAGKVAQAVVHGARLVRVRGNFDRAMALVRELARADRGVYLLNSINPYRLEGQKTIAFEIVEQLGRVPDAVVLPVGNAGNVSALWKGFTELLRLGRIRRRPRMIGVQAAGAAPIARAMRTGRFQPQADPATVASAIRIGNPVSVVKAIRAFRESRGEVATVTDREILDAQRRLAETEGLFVEPASAAPIALLHRARIRGCVVAVATGHGLKDPDAVAPQARFIEVPPELPALRRALR